MNICLVSRYYPPVVGGIEEHVANLARVFSSQGHQVRVITSHDIANEMSVDPQEPWVHKVVVPSLQKVRGVLYTTRGRQALKKLLASDTYEIVHWHGLFEDSVITKVAKGKCKLVFTNHSSNFLEWFDSRLKRKLLVGLIGHADGFIAPSHELTEKTRRLFSNTRRVWYISNGVDVERFSPKEMLKRNTEITVLCPRRLEEKNGVEYLIQAVPLVLRRFPHCRFVVAGGGYPENLARLKSLAKNLGVEEYVAFLGTVPHSEMPDLINRSDLVVLPSLKEATSLAGLEAMACGKPLVATKVGGLPEIVSRNENGLLVNERNPRELAEAILLLCSDKRKRKAFGACGRVRAVREFSWNEVARKTMEVYKSVLN